MHEMNNIKIVHLNVHNRESLYPNLIHYNPVQIFTPIRNRFAGKLRLASALLSVRAQFNVCDIY